MKKLAVIACGFLWMNTFLWATTWTYDFGTTTGSYTSTSSNCNKFLPQPVSGEDYVKVGGNGSINLDNPGLNNFGTGSELRIVAPSTGDMAKVSIYDFFGTLLFFTRFNILFGDSAGGNTADSGVFYLILGNGNSFSTDASINRDESFTVLSFTFSDADTLTVKYLWGISSSNILSNACLKKGTNNIIEIWCNNNNISKYKTYYRNGAGSYTIYSNKLHLWINGKQYILSKANLPNDNYIDSFMFCGEMSKNNVANCFIDNIVYSNGLYSSPSTQASFFSNQTVTSNSCDLTWTVGNGNKRIVILSTNNNIIAPEDGTDPEPNSVYCNKGQQVVYNGTGNSVTVSGLSSSTAYYAKVFEVNGSGIATMYNTTESSENSIQFITSEDTLPVELSNFRAELDYQNRIQLMWVTQSEVNLLGYYIYRNNEDDVTSAELISPIITASNTTSTQLYVFTDTSVNEAGSYYYWLQCIDYKGNEKFFGPSICRYEFPGTNSGSEIPLQEGIRSIFPNPFNPCTTINYEMESAGSMELTIYNIKGQKVLGKTFEHSEKGNYKFLWGGCDEKGKLCSSGIYTVIMRCGERNYIRKMTILQ